MKNTRECIFTYKSNNHWNQQLEEVDNHFTNVSDMIQLNFIPKIATAIPDKNRASRPKDCKLIK